MKLSLAEMRLAINMVHGYESVAFIETRRVPCENGGPAIDVFLFRVKDAHPKNVCFVWQGSLHDKSTSAQVVMQTVEVDTAEKAVFSIKRYGTA